MCSARRRAGAPTCFVPVTRGARPSTSPPAWARALTEGCSSHSPGRAAQPAACRCLGFHAHAPLRAPSGPFRGACGRSAESASTKRATLPSSAAIASSPRTNVLRAGPEPGQHTLGAATPRLRRRHVRTAPRCVVDSSWRPRSPGLGHAPMPGPWAVLARGGKGRQGKGAAVGDPLRRRPRTTGAPFPPFTRPSGQAHGALQVHRYLDLSIRSARHRTPVHIQLHSL